MSVFGRRAAATLAAAVALAIAAITAEELLPPRGSPLRVPAPSNPEGFTIHASDSEESEDSEWERWLHRHYGFPPP
jgi:hypothetical protein